MGVGFGVVAVLSLVPGTGGDRIVLGLGPLGLVERSLWSPGVVLLRSNGKEAVVGRARFLPVKDGGVLVRRSLFGLGLGRGVVKVGDSLG